FARLRGYPGDRGDLPRAGAAVVAEAVDDDVVRADARRLHLEADGRADVDAHVGGEALDVVVADPRDVPVVDLVTGLLVLAGDRVGRRGTGVGRARPGQRDEGAGDD